MHQRVSGTAPPPIQRSDLNYEQLCGSAVPRAEFRLWFAPDDEADKPRVDRLLNRDTGDQPAARRHQALLRFLDNAAASLEPDEQQQLYGQAVPPVDVVRRQVLLTRVSLDRTQLDEPPSQLSLSDHYATMPDGLFFSLGWIGQSVTWARMTPCTLPRSLILAALNELFQQEARESARYNDEQLGGHLHRWLMDQGLSREIPAFTRNHIAQLRRQLKGDGQAHLLPNCKERSTTRLPDSEIQSEEQHDTDEHG